MAMRRIVQSLGSKTFKAVYAARLQGTSQQGPIANQATESKGGKASQHANKDTYAPPQHKDYHLQQEAHPSWEKIKDDISSGRPGGQQSQQPWMEKAKETLTQAAGFLKEKTNNIDAKSISETAENLKEGAKEKLSAASEFIKSKTGTEDLTTAAKEKVADLTEGAKDKLAQAQEFVRKQTVADSTKKVKASAKEKYQDLKYTSDQKKKITEEAWDFSKLEKGSDAAKDKTADFAKKDSKFSGEQSFQKSETTPATEASKGGIIDSVKETAANAAEWVKDKLTPSGSEKINENIATDEKVHAATDKLKSEIKTNEDTILKDSVLNKDKSFSDEKVDKKY